MKKVIVAAIAITLMAGSLNAANSSSFSESSAVTVVTPQDKNPLAEGASVETVAAAINWDKLDELVTKDETLTTSNKTSYGMIKDLGDPAAREKALRKAPYYDYLRTNLYPKALNK